MLTFALALASSTQLDRCLNSGEAARGVTPAMAACYGEDYKRADAVLNATYHSVLNRLPPSRQVALRASQRAWIITRDKACPLDEDPGAGTIERLNHPACLTKQTTQRTAWLRRYR